MQNSLFIYFILFFAFFVRTAKVKDADWNNPLASDTSRIVSSQPGNGNRSGNVVPDAPRGAYIQRINNDAREDEMEENMQAVGGILGNLKNMAQDMGDEIGRQNKQVDRIGDKVIFFFFQFFLLFLEIYFHFFFLGNIRWRQGWYGKCPDRKIT